MMSMKRKEPGASEEHQPRRRQPQTSCDFCRKKKLKCDREVPCSSCVTRGLTCTGQPGPGTATRTSFPALPNDVLLERLRSLEQAVFASSKGQSAGSPTDVVEAQSRARGANRYPSAGHTPVSSILESEHHQTAKMLDNSYTQLSQDDFMAPGQYGCFGFKVAASAFLTGGREDAAVNSTSIQGDLDSGRRVIHMMTREEALLLLDDFTDHAYHLLPIVHESSARALIIEFYARLSQGQEVRPAEAALILTIASTSAYFWHKDAQLHADLKSSENAARAALAWRRTAWDILNESMRIGRPCLEGVQAWSILAYLIYNVDGCSASFRFLHNCSVSVARELSLHIVDSPRSEQNDDLVTREIKRRIWWHLAATDWLLGFMGGPVDGTYSISPRHMNVKYPRNLNDNDLALCDDTTTSPLNTPTQMSCFIQRIRLAEIIRSIMDAKEPGSPEADILDYNKVLALDRLFEQGLCDLPPFLRVNAPIPPESIRHLELQRAIIHLGFLSRRSRLHRPFLLQSTTDSRYAYSREICLRSARTVLSIATGLLEKSLGLDMTSANGNGSGRKRVSAGPSSHRLGAVINHMFMACTVLALNVGLTSGRVANGTGGTYCVESQPEDTDTHTLLTDACRVLAVAGEESTVAAGLVRSLVDVLKRYRVQGVDTAVTGIDGGRSSAVEAQPTRPEIEADSHSAAQNGYEMLPQSVTAEQDLGLDGLWDDLMGNVGMTDGWSGWNQLFADLDSYCGTA